MYSVKDGTHRNRHCRFADELLAFHFRLVDLAPVLLGLGLTRDHVELLHSFPRIRLEANYGQIYRATSVMRWWSSGIVGRNGDELLCINNCLLVVRTSAFEHFDEVIKQRLLHGKRTIRIPHEKHIAGRQITRSLLQTFRNAFAYEDGYDGAGKSFPWVWRRLAFTCIDRISRDFSVITESTERHEPLATLMYR